MIGLNAFNQHIHFFSCCPFFAMSVELGYPVCSKTLTPGLTKYILNISGLTGMFEDDVLVQKSNLIK